jgi:hypothetical protein
MYPADSIENARPIATSHDFDLFLVKSVPLYECSRCLGLLVFWRRKDPYSYYSLAGITSVLNENDGRWLKLASEETCDEAHVSNDFEFQAFIDQMIPVYESTVLRNIVILWRHKESIEYRYNCET